jgi:small-conductance mechanosensitive channel
MSKFICLLAAIMFFLSVTAQEISDDTEVPQELENFSGAEILIRLQRYIATDQQRLIQLRNRNAQLTQEVENLTQQFNNLDTEYQESRQTDTLLSESLEQRWEYVRANLDLLLQSRLAVQQQINVLENKVEKQKEVVDYITLGQILASDDTVEMAPGPPDTIVREKAVQKIQHRKVLEAIEDLERLEAKLRILKHNLLLVEQLIRLNREDLELAQAIAEASAKQLSLYEEYSEELKGARMHLEEVRRRIMQDTALVSSLKARIENLENVYTPVVNAVNNAEQKVEAARERLEFLQSPLAPHRIVYWLRYNLPRIAIILGILIVIWIATRWATSLTLNRLKKRRKDGERLERIETLKLASNSIITILIVLIGIIILLSELGVDLTVVLGGAAVISLAIAFGAQSLVKDYFSGFMILLENQYRVGNVVRINKTTGVVENISLRLTVLRDLEGMAHFIPHGQITEVSNLTHGWSQIVFDIGVSYNENVDHVMKVLTELATQMKDDREYGPLIANEPEMLGVDAFAQSAIVIKFLVRTKPLKQWMVKRELLRRIKNRFDELGIEIPFPHLTLYHRNSESPEYNAKKG